MKDQTSAPNSTGCESSELIIRARPVDRVVSKHAPRYDRVGEGSESGEGEAGEGSSEGGSNN